MGDNPCSGGTAGTAMTAALRIVCDHATLAMECARLAEALGISIATGGLDGGSSSPAPPLLIHLAVTEDHPEALAQLTAAGATVAWVTCQSPSPETLLTLSRSHGKGSEGVLLCVIGEADEVAPTLALAGDLGIVAVDDVPGLMAAIALSSAGARRPWTASMRALHEPDRLRLTGAMLATGKADGRFVPGNGGLLAWEDDRHPMHLIGTARNAAAAVAAIHAARDGHGPDYLPLANDPRAVHDVLLGPPRALSDPASKTALAPYGIPIPVEELCASPSRTASEAATIGFPVRIALASPDLRVWDHPELAVDGVDSAARARDVFRQITALAQTIAPAARLLGVTVTATASAEALLRVAMTPLGDDRVLSQIGFADPHGVAAGDQTYTVLPASTDRIGRVLARLAGSPLLLAGNATDRRRIVDAVSDVLGRLAAFLNDHREAVDAVEIDPLAVLVGGNVEVREACVRVGDYFQRSLEGSQAPTAEWKPPA